VDGQVPVSQDPNALTPVLEPEKRYLYSTRSLWYPQGQGTDYATASLKLTDTAGSDTARLTARGTCAFLAGAFANGAAKVTVSP